MTVIKRQYMQSLEAQCLIRITMLDSIYLKIWQRVFPKYPCTKKGKARIPETLAKRVCNAVKDEKRRDVISA